MADQARELVVLTRGTDHELSSVGVTIANGDMTAGLTMSIFLVGAAVDPVREPRGRHHASQSARPA
jgi:hypothetical protein